MKPTRPLIIWIAAITVSGNSLLAAEPSAGNATNTPKVQTVPDHNDR